MPTTFRLAPRTPVFGARALLPTLVATAGLAILVLAAAGCSDATGGATTTDFESGGPYPAGNTTLVLTDPSRDRALTVEVWYPASQDARAAAAAGEPVQNFYPPGELRDRYIALLAQSPDPGPSRTTASARDAAPAEASPSWPLLVFSHCHGCTRFSSFTIAERLASHGFVVAAPDHAGNGLFDERLGLDAPTLQLRAADVRFVTDALLAGSSGADALPADLRRALDASRVGVFGHSFGGVTTGLVLQDDDRFRAGAAIAAPFENPLLTGVAMSAIAEPVLFLVAREDNSIAEIGNQFIRANFDAAPAPIWKAEVTDAGHWSFSDICHLGTSFTPGCGEGVRQTRPGEPFNYLPIDTGRAIGAAYVTAFFAAELNGDAAGRAYLEEAHPPGIVDVAWR